MVSPSFDDRPVVAECWSRRYRCTRCRSVLTVLPVGVLPRFLYSMFAIVMAFLLVGDAPVGDGLSDADAYDRQGMYPVRCWRKPWAYRWRSLGRWVARIEDWWPGLPADLQGLLVGVRRRAGLGDRRALVAAAVASHARWGVAM